MYKNKCAYASWTACVYKQLQWRDRQNVWVAKDFKSGSERDGNNVDESELLLSTYDLPRA